MLEIDRVIGGLYPNAKNIQHIDHGYENHIVIVNDEFVVRFPRDSGIWEWSKLERYVLSELINPLIPKIVSISENPPYMIQTFLPGEHLSEDEFRKLPDNIQRSVGKQLAEFAYNMHSSIGVKKFEELHSELAPRFDPYGTYLDYLTKNLYSFTFPTPEMDKVAKKYYSEFKSIKPSKPVVVHDDLHVHNLLFQDGKLSGVMDFGAVCVGTAEQELRQVFRLSDIALEAAVKTYNSLANTELDTETAKTWMITQELAGYSNGLQSDNVTNPGPARALDHLKLWFQSVF